MADVFGVIVSLAITLMVFSQLFKYTVLFKIAEMAAVACTVANLTVLAVINIWGKGGQMQFWAPVVLGLMFFAVYIPKYQWLSRYPIALMVGVGTGITLRTVAKTQILDQVVNTIARFNTKNAFDFVSATILTIGVITSVSYFIFTSKFRGRILVIPKIGQIFLYGAIGVVLASAMLADFSLAVDRIRFIISAISGKLF